MGTNARPGYFALLAVSVVLPTASVSATQSSNDVVQAVIAAPNGNKPKELETPKAAALPPRLVAVPGGRITMGILAKDLMAWAKKFGRTPVQRQQYRRLMIRELGKEYVQIMPFMISKYEVTNEQYAIFVKAVWPKVRFPFSWWPPEDLDEHRRLHYEENKRLKALKLKEEAARKKASTDKSLKKGKDAKKAKAAPTKKSKSKDESPKQDKKAVADEPEAKIRRRRIVDFKPEDYWTENYEKLKWGVPAGRERFPVTWITYSDAKKFASWAGLRLPSEPEWQRAFQGEKCFLYPYGNKWDKTRKVPSRPRAVGTTEQLVSPYGVHDMMGSVWEWTSENYRAYKGFRDQLKNLRRLVGRAKLSAKQARELQAPDFGNGKKIVRGGSSDNLSHAQLVFRACSRLPLGDHQRTSRLGFRFAKTLAPALDATTLVYRSEYNHDNLAGHKLALPARASAARNRTGQYPQRGIERWDFRGELISGYHMVSIVPVFEVLESYGRLPRDIKEYRESSYRYGLTDAHGHPIAAIFTTEELSLSGPRVAGKIKVTKLPPSQYTLVYRAGGINEQLKFAMLAGAKELRLYKGLRKVVAQAKKLSPRKKKALARKKAKEAKRKAREALKKEREARRNQGKKKKPKKKKSKKQKQREAFDKIIAKAAATWTEVVDDYCIPDKITAGFPKKKKPTMMTINPGKLEIPIYKDILLLRNNEGHYIAWMPYKDRLVLTQNKDVPGHLSVDMAKGEITYTGGPRMNSAFSIPFKFSLKLDPAELAKNWILPK